MGLLTIREAALDEFIFEPPNRVIEALYYRFFREQLLQCLELSTDDMHLSQRVSALALRDDMAPLAEALQMVLERLSNRDAHGWSEKHVKAVLMALLVPTGVYGVFSEWPVGQGYADIYLKRRPPIVEPKHEHLIELKYLKKQEADLAEAVRQGGRRQVEAYLSQPDVARQGDVLGWLMLIVGTEVKVEHVGAP
ncbi:MAG: PD-(D/E)XK nuclease domain-containing protein [Saprospiraceae bacterium]|nr:PD-(D/E)XK nuclease domain-containing protein [Saprospiraceae bacterium]MDW8228383.1 PD-(D/E)XK nuclease domain-containing protein [Saprospiraceae bacterium]